MKYLFSLFPVFLAAQVALPNMGGEEKQPMPQKKQEQVAAASSARSSEVLLIDPAARAKDLASAFQFIRKLNPGAKLSMKLTSGQLLTDILSVDPMDGGTLVIFKLNTLHGVKYQVEKIENIDSIVQS